MRIEKNKKAQGISLNVIIIAAFALLVLAILSVVFLGRDHAQAEPEHNRIEKEEAMRLCKLLYIEKEIVPAIHDNIKERNLTVYFDGLEIRSNCYYKEFMDEVYYDIHHVINSTECCSIWDDYRVACRWNCDLQPGQYYSIADYNNSDSWYHQKVNNRENLEDINDQSGKLDNLTKLSVGRDYTFKTMDKLREMLKNDECNRTVNSTIVCDFDGRRFIFVGNIMTVESLNGTM